MKDFQKQLQEIITIYRKIKQGSGNKEYKMMSNVNTNAPNNILSHCFPIKTFGKLRLSKYLLYSASTGVLQSENFFLPSNFSNSFFWLNIFDPNSSDIASLNDIIPVHEVTLLDIQEKDTTEKIDFFKDYIFISLKLFTKRRGHEDMDFNIIISDKCIITTHDRSWEGIEDIIYFLSIVSGVTKLTPDWVVYSIIIEFLQDIKSYYEEVEAHIDILGYESSIETLRNNFRDLYELFLIRQFIKPKLKIIRSLCKSKYVCSQVSSFLKDASEDFSEIDKQLVECKNIFERSQDIIISMREMKHSEHEHQLSKSMNKLSLITLLFLPIQAVSGIFGMNVKVPWQNENTVRYFWILVLIGPIISILFFIFNKRTKTL